MTRPQKLGRRPRPEDFPPEQKTLYELRRKRRSARAKQAAFERWIVRARAEGYSWQVIARAAMIDKAQVIRIHRKLTGEPAPRNGRRA